MKFTSFNLEHSVRSVVLNDSLKACFDSLKACFEVNSQVEKAKMILNHNSTRIFLSVSWALLWAELVQPIAVIDLGG